MALLILNRLYISSTKRSNYYVVPANSKSSDTFSSRKYMRPSLLRLTNSFETPVTLSIPIYLINQSSMMDAHCLPASVTRRELFPLPYSSPVCTTPFHRRPDVYLPSYGPTFHVLYAGIHNPQTCG